MASWKKILVEGGALSGTTLSLTGLSGATETTALMINGSDVVSTRALGSNAFSNDTIGTTTAALTAGPGLTSAGTFTGATARTFSVNSGSMAAFFSSSAFSKVSGEISIAGNGAATVANNVIDESNLKTSVAGTGLTGGDGTALSVDIDGLSEETMATGDTIAFNDDGDNGLHKITVDNLMTTTPKLVSEDTIAQASDYILFLDGGATGDTKKESVADFVDAINGTGLSAGSGQLSVDLSGLTTVNIGTSTSEVTVGDNLTVVGDLTVQGATTTLSTTNTEVKDQFILLNSGSNSGDGGIIVQNGSTKSGSAFFWDDSNDRWGFTTGSAASAFATSQVPSAYASAVVTDDTVIEYRKNGNIRIDGSGNIYIYVE